MSFARSRWTAIVVCILASCWAAFVLGAPWLAASGGSAGARLSAASYLAGAVVCHQRPERSFHLSGAQLPVCARCTGLYVSGALGLMAGVGLAAARRREPSSIAASRRGWRVVLAVSLLPILLSLAAEWLGSWPVSNAWRAASAVPAGWAAGALLAEFLSFQGKL